MAYIELPKDFHPDFSSPHKKPVNPLELDRTSSLVRGLVLDVEMTEGFGAPRDLVTGNSLTSNGQGWGITDGDRETTYSASSDDSVNLVGLEDFSGDAHTVHVRARVSAFDNSGLVIFGWADNGVHFWHVLNNVFIAGQLLVGNDHDDANDTYHDWVFISDPVSDKLKFYEDGVLLNSGAAAVTLPAGPKTLKIGAWSDSTEFSLDGGIKFVRAWNRALTKPERLALLKDNYRLHLKPAIPQYFFTVSGGGTSAVSNAISIDWNMLAYVGNGYQSLWNLLSPVSAQTSVKWDLLQSVLSNSELKWSLVESVNNNAQFDWDLLAALAAVSNSTQSKWNLLNQVSNDLGVEWDLLATVGASTQLDWDLLSALSTISNGVQFKWDMGGKVKAQLDAQWSLLESVGVSTDLRWDLAVSVATQVQAKWELLKGVESNVDLQWDSISATSTGLEFKWNLLSDSVRIPIHVMLVLNEDRIMKILN